MLNYRSSSSSKRNMNDDGNMMHLMQGVHLNDPANGGMYTNDDMYAQSNGLVSGGSFQNNSTKMLQANASQSSSWSAKASDPNMGPQQ
jgi:hypothetical protein